MIPSWIELSGTSKRREEPLPGAWRAGALLGHIVVIATFSVQCRLTLGRVPPTATAPCAWLC